MYSSSSNFQTSAQTVFNSTAQQGRVSSAASSKGINSVLRGQGISTVVTPTATAFLSLSGSSSTFSPSIIDNIEQTFIDFQSVPVSQSSAPGAHMQSGFVPPVIDPIPQEQTFPRDLSVPRTPTSEFSPTSKASSHPSTTPNMVTTGTVAPPAHMQGGIHEQMNNWHQSGGPNSNSPSVKQGPRRHTGPRPPKNESNISPEEAERRRVRRERNKLAAAKCRKRRMDHTSQLQEEVEELESIQQEIHGEIMSLQKQKEQLEFILEAHKVQCKRGIPIHTLPAVYVPPLTVHNDADVKPDFSSNLSNDSMSSATSSSSPAPPMQARSMLSSTTPSSTPASVPPSAPAIQRPTSLPIIVKQEPQDGTHPESMDINVTQATGISISTPRVSPRVLSLFDTIGDHTGLTPITGSGIGSNGTPISGGSMTTPFAANASQMRLGGPSDASTPASHDRSAEKPNSHTLMSL